MKYKCSFSLQPLVINPTFLFPLYFIQGEGSVRGAFLNIYAISEGWKTENGKGVCTRAASCVQTVGGFSADNLL